MAAAAVQIVGLRETRLALSAVSSQGSKAMRRGMLEAARQIVPKVKAAYPKRTGELAGSVKASAGGQSQTIRVRPSEPYAGPVDFGGWPPGRPFIGDGRYLYPTVYSEQDKIVELTEKAVQHTISLFF